MGDFWNFPADDELRERLDRAADKLGLSREQTITEVFEKGLDMILSEQVQSVRVDSDTFRAVSEYVKDIEETIKQGYPVDKDLLERERWVMEGKDRLEQIRFEGAKTRDEHLAKKLNDLHAKYEKDFEDVHFDGWNKFRLCAEVKEAFEEYRIDKQTADKRLQALIGKDLSEYLDLVKKENPGVNQFGVRKRLQELKEDEK